MSALVNITLIHNIVAAVCTEHRLDTESMSYTKITEVNLSREHDLEDCLIIIREQNINK